MRTFIEYFSSYQSYGKWRQQQLEVMTAHAVSRVFKDMLGFKVPLNPPSEPPEQLISLEVLVKENLGVDI
jgi:hypothetical protein